MISLEKVAKRVWDKLFLLILVSGVLLPVSPLNMQYTLRDSGVFLYVGWRILNGELPYRDVWDHKPPVIFYINALGLSLSNGSRWGVWWIEFLFLFLAAYAGYKILKDIFGVSTAIFITFLWLLSLIFVIQGGNFATEYVLPMQFITLWLAKASFEKPTSQHWRWLIIGLLGATAFFTKQNAVGVWISAILFLTVYRIRLRQLKPLFQELLSFLGGMAVVFTGWILFFGVQGGLSAFWNTAFEYNLNYFSSGIDASGPIKPLIEGILPLTKTGLLQLAGIGYLIGLLMLSYKRDFVKNWLPLLGIGLIDLPVELFFLGLSGRAYAHYYMTILPVLTFFAGITVWTIFSSHVVCNLPALAKSLLVVDTILVFLWMSFAYYMYELDFFRSANLQHEIVTFIQDHTKPDETVLLWGAETTINFYSERKSPSRFVYQYPLYSRDYVTEKMIVQFLDELIQSKPRLIIDTKNGYTPLYRFPMMTEPILERITYLQCHYRPLIQVFFWNWTIYEYTAEGCDR